MILPAGTRVYLIAMAHLNCLTIAGSDSGGGAGIQGDLKTFTVLGAFGMSVITALTAQNTVGVASVLAIPATMVRDQLRAVLDDIPCNAAKTGMLANAEIIEVIADELRARPRFPLVVDPVMVSTTGATLFNRADIEAMREVLLPLAAVATPNSSEAEALSGMPVRTVDEAKTAAVAIARMGPEAVLITGGHLDDTADELVDVLLSEGEFHLLRSPRVFTPHTHGSGCALASAICVGLAQSMPLLDAVNFAREFIHGAIRTAGPLGAGNGPVNHLWKQS